jgi:hypothetical protein
MGWTDREPYFSQITDRQAELEEQGVPADDAWTSAYQECVDRLVALVDRERKEHLERYGK